MKERAYPDRGTHTEHALPSSQAVCAVHGNGADIVLSQMLGNLQHQSEVVVLHLQGGGDGRQLTVEVHVHDGTDDLQQRAAH